MEAADEPGAATDAIRERSGQPPRHPSVAGTASAWHRHVAGVLPVTGERPTVAWAGWPRSATAARARYNPVASDDQRAVLKWDEPATPAAEIRWRPLWQLESVVLAGELERGLVLIGGEMTPAQFREIRAALVEYGLIVLPDAPRNGNG